MDRFHRRTVPEPTNIRTMVVIAILCRSGRNIQVNDILKQHQMGLLNKRLDEDKINFEHLCYCVSHAASWYAKIIGEQNVTLKIQSKLFFPFKVSGFTQKHYL